MPSISALHRPLIDLMFPQHCKGCGSRSDGGGTLCSDCIREIPLRLHPFTSPTGVRAAWALGVYEGVLESMICRGKYGKDGQAIALLGDYLGRAVGSRLPQYDAVTHVPASWIGRWQRGFDQAEQLAKSVAKPLGLTPCTALTRKAFGSQAGRTKMARRKWAQMAFDATHTVPARVLLVDDVCTTGSTVAACADSLLEAGAVRVDLVCVARTRNLLE